MRRSASRGSWAWACGWPSRLPLSLEGLQALEDRDALAGAHLHDRLLPRAAAPARGAAALGLGLDAQRPDVHDVHVEQRLDRLADVRLVRVRMDAEGVAVGGREHVALLRDDRPDEYRRVLHQALASAPARGCAARALSASRAGFEMTSVAAPSRSLTPTSSLFSTATRARLRNDSAAADSSALSTTSAGRVRLVGGSQPSSSSLAWRVLGAVNAPASRIASEPRSACSESALRSAARCSLRLTLNV